MRLSRRLIGRLAIWYVLVLVLASGLLLAGVWAFAGRNASWHFWAPISTALAGVLAAWAALWVLSTDVRKSLDEITDAVTGTSRGDFSGRLALEEDSQAHDLATAVNAMNERLAARFSEIEAEQNQLRTVLDSMVEGVIALDAAQRVLLLNSAARRLLGLRSETARGRLLGELVRHPELEQCVNQAVRQPEPVLGEMELLVGEPRILSVGAVGLPGQTARSSPRDTQPGGRGRGAVVVMHDVTELRRLERVRQEFVANASHELKTPLASIAACVETLIEGAIDDTEARGGFLQAISEQAGRLDALVRDLLAMARADSRERDREIRPVRLDQVAAACVEKCRQAALRNDLSLRAEGKVEAVSVAATVDSLEQILDNLLDNAIKYTPAGGSVHVQWWLDEPFGVVEITDTGIGIPQAHIHRIFERFYRVDRARSREVGGTGLGLSIVKNLVQDLGGTVAARSRVGKGSTFTVRIPLSDSQRG